MVQTQRQVVEQIRGTIPFQDLIYNFTMDMFDHGDILNRALTQLFYHFSYDCVLILDIDAVPLNRRALSRTLELAYDGNLVGNIQRSNHCDNGQHTFVAPSYMCFTRDYYEKCGHPNLAYTNKWDTGELLTVNAGRFGLPVVKFMPCEVTSPTYDTGEYWPLADGMPYYGIGTTFEYGGEPMSYHLFSAVRGVYNHYFYKKCADIMEANQKKWPAPGS
jgi:hypothetical protein